jgi:hypothetical protein
MDACTNQTKTDIRIVVEYTAHRPNWQSKNESPSSWRMCDDVDDVVFVVVVEILLVGVVPWSSDVPLFLVNLDPWEEHWDWTEFAHGDRHQTIYFVLTDPG